MSADAFTIPTGEDAVAPPPFNPADLCVGDGALVWAPEVLLGVDLQGVGTPDFLSAVSSRHRRLQADVHPDRGSGNAEFSR